MDKSGAVAVNFLSFDDLKGINSPLRRDVRTRDRTGRKEPVFADAKSWDFDLVDTRRNFLVLKGDNIVFCAARRMQDPARYRAKFSSVALSLEGHLFLVTSDFTEPSGPKGVRKAIKGTARVLIYGR